MSGLYAVVLRGCEAASLNTVTGLLGRAFSLKEGTCTNILQSCPIILVDGLDENEAAAISLCLRTIEVAGATFELITQESEDLPKIDWPKKPTIFKQSLPALIRAYELPLNLGGSNYNLLDLLKARLNGSGAEGYAPVAVPGTQQQGANSSSSNRLSSVHEFTGANLPEVTPFSNVALSDPDALAPVQAAPTAPTASSDDIGDRMNELFGDDDDELVPSSNHITNILDRILPDEEPGTGTIKPALNPITTSAPSAGPEVSGANQIPAGGTGDFS